MITISSFGRLSHSYSPYRLSPRGKTRFNNNSTSKRSPTPLEIAKIDLGSLFEKAHQQTSPHGRKDNQLQKKSDIIDLLRNVKEVVKEILETLEDCEAKALAEYLKIHIEPAYENFLALETITREDLTHLSDIFAEFEIIYEDLVVSCLQDAKKEN